MLRAGGDPRGIFPHHLRGFFHRFTLKKSQSPIFDVVEIIDP